MLLSLFFVFPPKAHHDFYGNIYFIIIATNLMCKFPWLNVDFSWVSIVLIHHLNHYTTMSPFQGKLCIFWIIYSFHHFTLINYTGISLWKASAYIICILPEPDSFLDSMFVLHTRPLCTWSCPWRLNKIMCIYWTVSLLSKFCCRSCIDCWYASMYNSKCCLLPIKLYLTQCLGIYETI